MAAVRLMDGASIFGTVAASGLSDGASAATAARATSVHIETVTSFDPEVENTFTGPICRAPDRCSASSLWGP